MLNAFYISYFRNVNEFFFKPYTIGVDSVAEQCFWYLDSYHCYCLFILFQKIVLLFRYFTYQYKFGYLIEIYSNKIQWNIKHIDKK